MSADTELLCILRGAKAVSLEECGDSVHVRVMGSHTSLGFTIGKASLDAVIRNARNAPERIPVPCG
jgi:hypothetical protein